MKTLFLVCVVLLSSSLSARTLEVGAGRPFTSVQAAAAQAAPGDTILVRAGVYGGGEYIENLQGSPSAWITLLVAPGESVIYRGGSQAFHFVDAAYLRIAGFVFEGQTGNGVNMDDGGSYGTPAHSIIIEDCQWRAMNATGNNDQLKLSGVDTLRVSRCSFSNGSAGGSAIDMVGCHYANFEECAFTNGGSNSIQAKGGSQYIRIARNRFVNAGERALNIGGSTGAAFFRPLNANFEASDIAVFSNVFTGSMSPIAYVGAVRCAVMNNTIYRPGKWAIRILQETVGPNYLPCGENIFSNNIVVVTNAAANPTINIGSNTAPQTFLFSNNLWYNEQNTSWSGPNLPVSETAGILNRNPLLTDPANGDFAIPLSSPATGKGMTTVEPAADFLGRAFASTRSIGAVEGNPGTTSLSPAGHPASPSLHIWPNPSLDGRFMIRLDALERGPLTLTIVNSLGRIVHQETHLNHQQEFLGIRSDLPSGMYSVLLMSARGILRQSVCIVR
ncbi:MAG: hypothetical protein IPP94_03190 [Ignavibacteria bacterium]|nr:hypothetical protein [Ignavibacteria bacterium]